jgi:hypothetical protein
MQNQGPVTPDEVLAVEAACQASCLALVKSQGKTPDLFSQADGLRYSLRPLLRTVQDAGDFDGVATDAVDHHERQPTSSRVFG